MIFDELARDLKEKFTARCAEMFPGQPVEVIWDAMGDEQQVEWYWGVVQKSEPQHRGSHDQGDDGDILRSLEIDFSPNGPFWNAEETADEWLIRDFVARGRGHALYASAKMGKSFVALDAIAAAAIPGHTAWTKADKPITVVYLDYEMTEADVRERLEGFGYGPDDDYSRFHYVRAMAFGSDLDTHEGGAELLAYAQAVGAELVVVDTMSRAVRGDENDADTVRHFYQATGGLLKGHGIALLRLDHAGKSTEKGQRGSSGKNDDVDVVWRLERKEDGSELTCTHKRMHWVPDRVAIRSIEDTDSDLVQLRRVDGGDLWPAGTKEKVEAMDKAGLPIDATREQSRAAGVKGKNALLDAAFRWRREVAERGDPASLYVRGHGGDTGDTSGDTGRGHVPDPLRGQARPARPGEIDLFGDMTNEGAI